MTNRELANRLIEKGTELLNEGVGRNSAYAKYLTGRFGKDYYDPKTYNKGHKHHTDKKGDSIYNQSPSHSHGQRVLNEKFSKNYDEAAKQAGREAAKESREDLKKELKKHDPLTAKQKALLKRQNDRTLADVVSHPEKYPKGYARQLALNNECIANLLMEAAELLDM